MAEAALEGRVVRVDARQCEVLVRNEVRQAQLRGRLFEERTNDKSPVAVGDRVLLGEEGDDLVIDEVLKRRNVFARRAAGDDPNRRQLLASNIDQVVVVNSLSTPPFSSIAADRILITCSFAGIRPLLVLNKVDEAKLRRLEKIVHTYELAGVDVLRTSATRGDGVEELERRLTGVESVLYGLSGVGKSTLLNCIDPSLKLETREVSKSLKSGRHTTSFSRRYPLASGGAVIDTPGARKFRPHGIPPHELRLHMPEFKLLGRDCHYPDCTHRDEPDCAVLNALETDQIGASRYRSYLEVLAELEEAYGDIG